MAPEGDPVRPRLAVACTFSIHPAMGGGQVRARNLLQELAADYEVDVIALVDAGATPHVRQLAPGLREHLIPKSRKHRARELELEIAVDTAVSDVAMAELYALTPAYLDALAAAAASARAVVACHPYTFPAIRAVTDTPVWYDAQDVEAVLKRQVLGPGDEAQRLLGVVDRVERDCCQDAELIWACSEADRDELVGRYALDPSHVLVVPNGVSLDTAAFVPGETRRELRRSLRLPRRLAVFIASWHGPNIDGARALIPAARASPGVDFLVMGSVGQALRDEPLPANVELAGVVSGGFKQSALSVADVALNPVSTGSGTNLKMLEYFSVGAPVISTAFGARGIAVEPGRHFVQADPEDFPQALEAIAATPDAELDERTRRARMVVSERFSWPVVAGRLRAQVGALDAG